MRELTTQISHKELIDVWAPIIDVSRTLDIFMEKVGDSNAGEIIRIMDDKVKRALKPLQECIDRIERENPSAFGMLNG